jgi:hypothetical protein
MGHSAKKKSVTRKLDLLRNKYGNYEIAEPGTKTNYFCYTEGRKIFSFAPDLEVFCPSRFEKITGINLRKGEVAEMTVTITRKK